MSDAWGPRGHPERCEADFRRLNRMMSGITWAAVLLALIVIAVYRWGIFHAR